MPDKPISPLRQRMIDDMTARRIKEKVQKDYVRHGRARPRICRRRRCHGGAAALPSDSSDDGGPPGRLHVDTLPGLRRPRARQYASR